MRSVFLPQWRYINGSLRHVRYTIHNLVVLETKVIISNALEFAFQRLGFKKKGHDRGLEVTFLASYNFLVYC